MGGADCEAIHEGWLAQPVNAWSSVAFVVAGVWVVARSRSPSVDRLVVVAGGVALVLVGAGSFAYHGPQPSWGGDAHDGSILLLLGVLAVTAGPRLRRHAPIAPRVALIALAAGGAAWVLGRTDGPLCDPDSPLQLHAAWHLLAALATLLFFEEKRWLVARNSSKNG
jgi:hypothetical protein